MAIKYEIIFSNIDEIDVKVELSTSSYLGSPIRIRGVGGETASISRNIGDQPFENHVIPTTANINVYSSLIDVDEIQQSNDKDWRCVITFESVVKFEGYLIPDGVQRQRKGAGSVVKLNATCGLALMKGNKFNWGGNWGLVTVGSKTGVVLAPINFLRQIVGRSVNIGSKLPIRWSTSVKYDFDNTQDFFAGIMPFSGSGSFAELFAKNEVDTFWVLENIVKSGNCWIFQDNGYWNIVNMQDLASNNGVLTMHTVTTSSGNASATTTLLDFKTTLNGKEVNDDAYTMYKKSVGKVVVDFNHIQNANIIPNGDFSLVSTGSFVNWGFEPFSGSNPFYEIFDDLGKRVGNSAKLTNLTGATSDAPFSFTDEIAIDTATLYKEISLGFTFMPSNFGFAVDSNGVINWNNNPFRISISFTYDNLTYYLNEYGFWDKFGDGFANAEITGASFVAPTSEYRFAFNPNKNFFRGDRVSITVQRSGVLSTYNYTFNNTTSVQGGIDELVAFIPNSSRVGNSLAVVAQSSGSTTYSVTKADFFIQNIFPTVDNMKPFDVAKITFPSNGLPIKMPQIAQVKDGVNGRLKIRFHVKPGQVYTIDDVYVNVIDNKDRYELTLPNQNSTENYELGVSSSFSGFMLSTYKENYDNTNKFLLFNGGRTLTELYGLNVLRWRSKAKQIYSGSFRVQDFNMLNYSSLLGKNFVTLEINHNLSNGQISYKGFEGALDAVSPTVINKGTNDDKL